MFINASMNSYFQAKGFAPGESNKFFYDEFFLNIYKSLEVNFLLIHRVMKKKKAGHRHRLCIKKRDVGKLNRTVVKKFVTQIDDKYQGTFRHHKKGWQQIIKLNAYIMQVSYCEREYMDKTAAVVAKGISI